MSALAAWLAAGLGWQAMMTAMMAPVAWPWLRAAQRLAPAGTRLPAGRFALGYFTAWAPFSLLLAAAQLSAGGRLAGHRGAEAALLLGAGAWQLAPWKRACLRHCRNPLGFLLAGGAGGSLTRLGARHGIVCLGCCWALMATALGVGMMNLLWMAALAAATFAEQVLPGGARLRPLLGAALLVAGGVRLA